MNEVVSMFDAQGKAEEFFEFFCQRSVYNEEQEQNCLYDVDFFEMMEAFEQVPSYYREEVFMKFKEMVGGDDDIIDDGRGLT